MAKIERKLRAYFLDGSMTDTPDYYWIGDDLEDFTVEMNPEFKSSKNIKGAASTQLAGYDPQLSVAPYYADNEDEIYEKLNHIYNTRSTGNDCKSTFIEVEMNEQIQNSGSPVANTYKAWKENALIVIQRVGGDTSGLQFEFDVKLVGERKSGKFNTETKTFTEDAD